MLKSQRMESTDKVQLISTIILLGFVLAIFFHGFFNYLSFGFPYDTFLFQPWDRFKDFFCIYEISKDLNPYTHATNYFPLTYLIFYPLTWTDNPNASILIFFDIFCCFLCWNSHYYLKVVEPNINPKEYLKNIIIICFLSYPTLICLDRGNVDILLFIFVALFAITFAQKRYVLAAFLLAIAIGMKFYPIIFIILFFKEKRFYEAILCFAFTAVLTLFALASFKAGILESLHQLFGMTHGFYDYYIINDNGLSSSISLFSLAKVLLKYFYVMKSTVFVDAVYREAIKTMLPYYTATVFIIFAIITLYILIVERVFWKQVMLLVAMLALFPVMSGDYRLIFLFTPLFLFMVSPYHDRFDGCYAILFGLLFIPKNFYIFSHTLSYAFQCLPGGPCGNIVTAGYSVMSLLNIIILVAFIGLIVSSGIRQYFSKAEPLAYLRS